jgi:hypothetical protein
MALSKEMVAALNVAAEHGWTEADVVTFLRAVHRTGLPVDQVIAVLESVAAEFDPDVSHSGDD